MDLDGPLVNFEVAGDLLVEPAAQDVAEDLAFASTERGEACAKLLPAGPLVAVLRVAHQRPTQGLEQQLLRRRLFKNVLGPARIARTVDAVSACPVRKRTGSGD
jgi:hypothetical protein